MGYGGMGGGGVVGCGVPVRCGAQYKDIQVRGAWWGKRCLVGGTVGVR